MLSYQHAYHAGNFADVCKHSVLTRVLNYMIQKEKPLFYLETHAGRGLYDFKDMEAKKTEEYQEGIALLWKERLRAPALFTPYLDVIHSLNQKHHASELRYYPGSPYLALSMLRNIDRIYCNELHPREFSYLEQLPRLGKRVFFKHTDGLAEASALLPPLERRGLIVMDPSYEVKDDYKTIPRLLSSLYTRFATGVYFLWYPILDDDHGYRQLISGLKNIKTDKFLQLEFHLDNVHAKRMRGSGLWIINPPYGLEAEVGSIFNFLRGLFGGAAPSP